MKLSIKRSECVLLNFRKILNQKKASEKIRMQQKNNWLHDAPHDRVTFSLAHYHSFDDIINYLNALAITYPDRVRVMPIGITHEGRQIPLIQIGKPSRRMKPGIWIDGGIHAREWISPAVVLYMINQLVEKYDKDAEMRNLVDSIDWFIAPLLNPDGYEYSRSSTHPDIRLWRKNRSPQVCIQTRQSNLFLLIAFEINMFSFVETRCCQGVDLNRNFDWDFGVEGSSTDPCSEIYQGAYAFSEPETRAVRDFLTSHNAQMRAFLTFHSYSQILMYPFGHQVRTYTSDVRDLRNTALHAANALRSLYGTKYTVGTGADTLYPASGGSEDWAKGRMRIKYSYLFELRPEDEVWDGFLLAENQRTNNLFLLILLSSLISFVNTFNVNPHNNSYEKYSVLRLQTNNAKQFETVRDLFKLSSQLRINFWKATRNISGISDIMVPSSTIDKVLSILKNGNVNVTTTIDDVEKLITDREKRRDMDTIYGRRYKDDEQNNALNYDFYTYGSYPQMVTWMRALARQNPKIVQFISIGKSHEGRSIDGLEIGGGSNRTKRVFWIDGGIHAREWAAPHTALYFIHQLVSKYGHDPTITNYVNTLTWVIVPCLNPDGYEFTRSSTNPNVRLWRKNRSQSTCSRDQWGRNRCCRGVDLNRNFDFHFKESGSSDDPCSEIYQGKEAFSEPETRAVRDAILSNRYRDRIDGFITLHTYSQIWIHPYGHRRDTYPGDVQDLYAVGKKATNALGKLYGTKYVVGSGADTLYPASGGSEDWAKQTANIKYVYLLELRPDERNWDGFILDEHQLIPTASETWAGVRVVADAVIERINKRTSRLAAGNKQYRFGDGTTGSCYDLRHACKRWIQQNETLCHTVPIFMREQCAYSCGHC
ncbi:unnamed protein product [Anisakis simplex]|uniref:ShKT domain-containing protein n=1 Tax=Anisakis simplex TaxID=6269 RepID=A0A0M3K3A2_ANISI|nr:unnamed protein product [Anisakis simplex]